MAKLSSVSAGVSKYPRATEPSKLPVRRKGKQIAGITYKLDYNVDSSTWK